MSYEQERAELERKLSVSREMQIRAEELKREKAQQAAELKRSQEAEQRKNSAIVEERALNALKSETAAAWIGSTESFEKAWVNGLAEQVRNDQVLARMRAGRAPIASLD